MFIGELKGLDQTKGLLNRAPNREVIDGYLSQDTIGVNNEQAPEMKLWHLKIYSNIEIEDTNFLPTLKILRPQRIVIPTYRQFLHPP